MKQKKQKSGHSTPMRIFCLLMAILVASGVVTYIGWLLMSLFGAF